MLKVKFNILSFFSQLDVGILRQQNISQIHVELQERRDGRLAGEVVGGVEER